MLLTKGDNALRYDLSFGSERIVGRVLGIDRAGRHLALDTRVWRTLGKFVAICSLIAMRLCDLGAALGSKRLGPRNTRVSTKLRYGVHMVLIFLLKVLLAVFGRWRANPG
jgi:hypothetical protein